MPEIFTCLASHWTIFEKLGFEPAEEGKRTDFVTKIEAFSMNHLSPISNLQKANSAKGKQNWKNINFITIFGLIK